MNVDWELAHSLTVDDGQGVRCACELPSSDDSYRLVIGTQGGSLYQWSLPSQSLTPISYQHNHSVTAILSNGVDTYVTGCKDNIIRVFDGATHEMKRLLEGHTKAVTSLDWCGGTYLVSGSWDGTAKLWDISNGALLATLPDHENTVTVCGLSYSGSNVWVATGSAGVAQSNSISGHSIRIWKIDVTTGEVNTINKVSNDHFGPIRDLTLDSQSSTLASCSNDGTVKLRDTKEGGCLQTLSFPVNDPPMLLSVTATSDGSIVAGAEDGHVVLWKLGDNDSAPPQLIRHSSSVWDVSSLHNGDFTTCCQDGVVRIFTQSHDRRASDEVKEHFAQSVEAALKKQNKGPSQEEISKLPKWELNTLILGKSEGQVQVFQKEGIAIAAQWSEASKTWIEVGQVVGGGNQEDTGVIDGVKYDFVMPIEVDQEGGGVAKLNIGYNTGENPFVAAQRFIDAHVLPQHHLAEIADYIQQRVGNSAPTIGASTNAAPVTGTPLVSFEYLPVKGYKYFELTKATNFEKVLSKIDEVGLLSKEEMATLQRLTDTLAVTNRYHASTLEPAAFSLLKKILSEWPPAKAFPALDLARLAVLHPASANWDWNLLLAQAYTLSEKDKDNVAVSMLALRLIVNYFKGPIEALDFKQVLAFSERFLASKNKNVRLSVVSVLWNVSLYLHSCSSSDSNSQSVVTQVASIIDSKTYESEAMFRALSALGTVLLAKPSAKEFANALFLAGKVEMVASPHGDKAKAIAKEIYALLQ
eukprot:CAMPEP_0194233014 /NCGR_PEP_ID=MMETSP0158-20130606/1139_1 /TAXON_ID=33649 /ORGANISM="Thalassionema nitzschioides, Strain L26-B" /LENGTH=752 /DNA_ID=CAMNT_0038965847 /DNA_START=13 /DNA_END=2274 /DNA_ORIENTATION=+